MVKKVIVSENFKGEKMEQIRVLQVLDFVNHNSGVSTVVMNYYMQLAQERVVCDFLLYEPAVDDLEQIIIARGGKIYTTGQPNVKNIVAYQNNNVI